MLIFNGELIEKEQCNLSVRNRGFNYGDALFETIYIQNSRPAFLEDHYFRLMASMRMLRMEIPMHMTFDYVDEKITKLLAVINSTSVNRVKIIVSRKEGGFYAPNTNAIDCIIEAFEGETDLKENYRIDLYKDFTVTSGFLSTVKSNNRLLNVISSIYAQENELDNCVLINEKKNVVEVSNANIYLLKGNVVKTPQLADGCIKGIARKKIIEFIEKHPNYEIEEVSISPFDLQKADEIFISNAIIGVQPVTQYKKKKFSTEKGLQLAKAFENLRKISLS